MSIGTVADPNLCAVRLCYKNSGPYTAAEFVNVVRCSNRNKNIGLVFEYMPLQHRDCCSIR